MVTAAAQYIAAAVVTETAPTSIDWDLAVSRYGGLLTGVKLFRIRCYIKLNLQRNASWYYCQLGSDYDLHGRVI